LIDFDWSGISASKPVGASLWKSSFPWGLIFTKYF
jgi:hypothetical protein